MAKKGQKQRKYDEEFIAKVLNENLIEGKASSYLAKKYNISVNTIYTWKHQYKKRGNIERLKKGRRPKNEDTDYKEKYEILKKFQEFLEEVDREKK